MGLGVAVERRRWVAHFGSVRFMVMVMNRPDCEDEEEDRECGEEGRAYLHGHQLVLSAADSSASS